jgi:DeoR/GlpR family transcriptional regulator of sugar metabolism
MEVRNARQLRTLTYLLDVGKSSVGEVQKRFGLVRRTVQRDLSKMTELGLVRERAASRTDPTRYYELL